MTKHCAGQGGFPLPSGRIRKTARPFSIRLSEGSMRKARIGLVCLARKTFDYQTAYEMYLHQTEQICTDTTVDWCVYVPQVIEPEDAEKASVYFSGKCVDAVILVSATFHLGQLALIIQNRIAKPLLLWGFSELPYDGGKIRLNAACGVNLDASNLYKAGVDSYCISIGDELDRDWVTAVKMQVAMQEAKIGIIGYRAQGFYNVGVDEMKLYSQLGVLIEHYELSDLFGQKTKRSDFNREKEALLSTFNTSKLTDKQIGLVANLICSAESFMKTNSIDALAIRCWPEFARDYGVSPCAMMSVLQSRGLILACEGDIEAALSMIAVRAAGEPTPFMADLSQVNYKENYALLWHDGVAPCNLWDGECDRSLETYFAGGKGVTADFVLKKGPMSILRIDTARGKTRIYYEEGEAVPMQKLLSGTYAKVLFSRHIREIVETVAYSGLAHHVVMGYVQYKGAVSKLSRIMGWELL